jgi:outer membrane protein assembly factor BamB
MCPFSHAGHNRDSDQQATLTELTKTISLLEQEVAAADERVLIEKRLWRFALDIDLSSLARHEMRHDRLAKKAKAERDRLLDQVLEARSRLLEWQISRQQFDLALDNIAQMLEVHEAKAKVRIAVYHPFSFRKYIVRAVSVDDIQDSTLEALYRKKREVLETLLGAQASEDAVQRYLPELVQVETWPALRALQAGAISERDYIDAVTNTVEELTKELSEPERKHVATKVRTKLTAGLKLIALDVVTDAITDEIKLVPSLKTAGREILSNLTASLTISTGSAMHRCNPARTGEYLQAGPVEQPTLHWSYDPPNGWLGAPIVMGDTVFLGGSQATGDRRPFRDYAGCIRAIDRTSGEERWHVLKGTDVGIPTIAADTLYIAASHIVEGSITKTRDGWSGRSRYTILALEAGTGATQWELQGSGERGPMPESVIAVEDTLFVTEGRSLLALSARDGSQRWRFDAPTASYLSDPAFADGMLYVGDMSSIYAVDPTTGSARWRVTTPMSWKPPVVANGFLYLATDHPLSRGDASVYAFDAATGTERWRFTDKEVLRSDWSAIAVAGGTVFVVSKEYLHGHASFENANYFLFAIDATTGREQWRFRTGSPFSEDPVVAAGTVYFSAEAREGPGGQLSALDAGSGEPLWDIQTHRGWRWSPAVVDQHIYVVEDGVLHAFGDARSSDSSIYHHTEPD